MQLRVVTPVGSKVDLAVTQVTVPGELGDMGILPGHRPLLSALGVGVLSYAADGATAYLAVNGGYVEVDDDGVIVVTETAESPDEIDIDRSGTIEHPELLAYLLRKGKEADKIATSLERRMPASPYMN